MQDVLMFKYIDRDEEKIKWKKGYSDKIAEGGKYTNNEIGLIYEKLRSYFEN